MKSDCDVFNTGHSSTSISAALGIARGRDLAGDNYNVISVFGDGALTGGMMYEAMNDAGQFKNTAYTYFERQRNVYFKNVGAVSKHLRSLRMSPFYFRSKHAVENFLKKNAYNRQTYRKYIKANKTFLPQACNPYNDF